MLRVDVALREERLRAAGAIGAAGANAGAAGRPPSWYLGQGGTALPAGRFRRTFGEEGEEQHAFAGSSSLPSSRPFGAAALQRPLLRQRPFSSGALGLGGRARASGLAASAPPSPSFGSTWPHAGRQEAATPCWTSDLTCRENDVLDWAATELVRADVAVASAAEVARRAAAGNGQGGFPAGGSPDDLSSVKPNNERWADTVREVDGLLEASLSNFAAKQGGKSEAEAAEEEKRQHVREMRRALRRQQQARDPHRKVELKLANRRRYGQQPGSGPAPQVPMQKVKFMGGHRGSVHIVDVNKIQSRCKELSFGNVSSMMAQLAKNELWPASATRVDTPGGARGPGLGVSCSEPVLLRAQRVPGTAQRQRKVQCQRRATEAADALRRLGQMRGGAPCGFRERLQAKLDVSRVELMENATEAAQPPAALSPPAAKGLFFAQPRREEGTRDLWCSSRSCATAKAPRGFDQCLASSGDVDGFEAQPAQALRLGAHRRWAKLRGVTFVLILLHGCRRQHRAMEIVKKHIASMRAWAGIRLAAARFRRTLRNLMDVVVRYVNSKRRGVDRMQRQWATIEDRHLGPFFARVQSQNAAASTRGSIGDGHRNGRGRRQSIEVVSSNILKEEDALSAIDMQPDWAKFRIPPTQRRQMLSRFYTTKLRKYVRDRQMVFSVARSAFFAQQDAVSFIRGLGKLETLSKPGSTASSRIPSRAPSEESLTHTEVPHVATTYKCFQWDLTEDVVLDLIALSAEDLCRGQDKAVALRFRDHPSMRPGHGQPFHRGQADALKRLRTQHYSHKMSDRAASLEAIVRTSSADRLLEHDGHTNAAPGRPGPEGGRDVGQLLDDFWPRSLAWTKAA